MPDLGEQLLQAMSIVSESSVKKINFDTTKTYNIKEVPKEGYGDYIVTDGSVSFTAYSDASYRVGETVYVQIPEGDFNNQKNIIGRKVTNLTEPYNYVRPLDQLIYNDRSILFDYQNWSLIPNKAVLNTETENDKKTIFVWEHNAELEDKEDIHSYELRGYDKVVISADIETTFSATSGSYGIRLYLTDKNNKVYKKDFGSGQMFGNLYPSGGYFNQEQIFDISEVPFINKIQVEFYEDSNFENLQLINGKGNLFLKDLKLYFGIGKDIKSFNIICNDGTNGLYGVYDSKGKILDSNLAQIKRTLSVDLSKDITNADDFELTWIFPDEKKSMIEKFNDDSTDSTYYIGDKYYIGYNENTIKAVIKIGNNVYSAEKDLFFGEQGTRLDHRSLVYQYWNNYALCSKKNEDDSNMDNLSDLQVQLSVLDSKKNKINDIQYTIIENSDKLILPKINETDEDGEIIVSEKIVNDKGIFAIKNKNINLATYPYLYLNVIASKNDMENLEVKIPLSISADRQSYSYITGPLEINYDSSGMPSYLKQPYKLYTETGIERLNDINWEIYNATLYYPNEYYQKTSDNNYILATGSFNPKETYYTQHDVKLKVTFFSPNIYYYYINNKYVLLTTEEEFLNSNGPYYIKTEKVDKINTLTRNDYESNNNLQYYYYDKIEKKYIPIERTFENDVVSPSWEKFLKDSFGLEKENFNELNQIEFSIGQKLYYKKVNNLVLFKENYYFKNEKDKIPMASRDNLNEGFEAIYNIIELLNSPMPSEDFKLENDMLIPLSTYFTNLEKTQLLLVGSLKSEQITTEGKIWVDHNGIINIVDIEPDKIYVENNNIYIQNNDIAFINNNGVLIYNDSIVWISPIRIYRENLNNSYYNTKTGTVEAVSDLDIYSPSMIVGSSRKNGFTGISIGDHLDTINNNKERHEGIYGFYEGSSVFGLRDNGTAFFGKDGGGRILIDGTKSTIESQQYLETDQKEGLIVDFDDGFLKASKEEVSGEEEKTYSKTITIDSGNENYPLIIGSSEDDIPKFQVDWNGVVHASDIFITGNLSVDPDASSNMVTQAQVVGIVNSAVAEALNNNITIANLLAKVTQLEERISQLEGNSNN